MSTSRKKKRPQGDPRKQTVPRLPQWTTFERMDPAAVAESAAQAIAPLAVGPRILAEAMKQAASVETWQNSRYMVRVYRRDDAIRALQVQDATGPQGPHWADLQRVKNEIAGPEAEAYEIYPAESRLIDGGGPVYWLFVVPPGERAPGGLCERPGDPPVREPIIDGQIPAGFREAPRGVRADYE